jgi:PAS domain S-box-containing protein
MNPQALDQGKRYLVGVIGNKTSLLPFWELFVSQGSGNVLSELGLVAAALAGEVPGEPFGPGMSLPVYPDFRAMLAAHPEINLVLESTGERDLLRDLRRDLPSEVALVERAAAGFFVRLLSTEQMWVACKVDLMHTQTLLKSISDQLSDDIFFLSPQGHVVDVNETACKRLGRGKKEFIGRNFREVFQSVHCPPPENVCDTPVETTVRTGEPSEAVQSEIDDAGRVRYYRIYTYPIFDDVGRLINVVAMRRDITRRTEMEQRLQQSEKLASIGQLSTYIAHEIRNPLFAISGFANSLLRQGNQDQASREKLGIILEESKRLDTILKSIINFSRPTEGRETAMDVNAVAEQSAEIMRQDCDKAGARLRLEPGQGLAKAQADPEMIKQCLINLIKNSIEAMPEGGDIIVRTAMAADRVTVEVADTGPGIPLDVRDKVFSPFFSTKGKGSGLGLAMIRKIMDDIGGDVTLSSVEGQGASVTLHLPPALAPDAGH